MPYYSMLCHVMNEASCTSFANLRIDSCTTGTSTGIAPWEEEGYKCRSIDACRALLSHLRWTDQLCGVSMSFGDRTSTQPSIVASHRQCQKLEVCFVSAQHDQAMLLQHSWSTRAARRRSQHRCSASLHKAGSNSNNDTPASIQPQVEQQAVWSSSPLWPYGAAGL